MQVPCKYVGLHSEPFPKACAMVWIVEEKEHYGGCTQFLNQISHIIETSY